MSVSKFGADKDFVLSLRFDPHPAGPTALLIPASYIFGRPLIMSLQQPINIHLIVLLLK